ncbi:MAG TPA: phytanoyl-CoA dioxygenase family protein [Polyangiaceae bacterium]|jgi:ectoine hydroxylase-related dioxygenase (phytanoyl-CoA dioxygenase family)
MRPSSHQRKPHAEAFERDGYCVVERLLSKAECETYKQEAHRVVREHAPRRRSVYVGVSVVSSLFRALSDDHRLVGILEELMPDGVMFMSDKTVIKSGRQRYASPWHIDAFYWPNTRGKVSIWIPLDDAREDNGTLKVVRGSHRIDWQATRGDTQQTNDEFENVIGKERGWRAEDEVTCSLPRGSAVFFSDRLVHGSSPSHTGADRYVWISTYHAACADEPFDLQFAARHVIVPAPRGRPSAA